MRASVARLASQCRAAAAASASGAGAGAKAARGRRVAVELVSDTSACARRRVLRAPVRRPTRARSSWCYCGR
eukprot:PRCOL_00005782-RA